MKNAGYYSRLNMKLTFYLELETMDSVQNIILNIIMIVSHRSKRLLLDKKDIKFLRISKKNAHSDILYRIIYFDTSYRVRFICLYKLSKHPFSIFSESLERSAKSDRLYATDLKILMSFITDDRYCITYPLLITGHHGDYF